MKYIITENQLDYIKYINEAKNIFFKYWNKKEPIINDEVLKLFGFNRAGRARWGEITITIDIVYGFLREYIGEYESSKIVKSFLDKKIFEINNCGGYRFKFEVPDYTIDSEIGQVNLTIDVILEDSEVTLIMTTGETISLKDAIDDVEIGWEIHDEVQGCVIDFFVSNLSNKTGYSVTLNDINFN